MFKLVWVAIVLMNHGPTQGAIPESTKFKTEQECIEFGKTMTPRLQDWVRGMLKAEWDMPVGVSFSCERDGREA